MRVSIPFSDLLALTTGTAGVTGAQGAYKLTGLWYPFQSGTSLPFGATTLADIYGGYRVHAVTLDITFSNPSNDGMVAVCAIQNSQITSTTNTLSVRTLDQKQYSDVRPLNNTGEQIVRIQRTFNIWEVEGLLRTEWLGNGGYSADVGANPSLLPQILINAGSALGTTGATVSVLVRITYHCEFFAIQAVQ
jgi:hypothetical protein